MAEGEPAALLGTFYGTQQTVRSVQKWTCHEIVLAPENSFSNADKKGATDLIKIEISQKSVRKGQTSTIYIKGL